MVFESFVVELANRYLGDFIENLDPSQLKIGIWGGDIVLNDLFIKESALKDLDLPIKVLHGHLGKLTLKIPWKNLYGAATEFVLDGLYIIAVPNVGVPYNGEKEEKAALEAKKKELERIEEAKKQEVLKKSGETKEEKADSFVDKLATNVIKNLQVTIKNIHVRYEDRFTNPGKPFTLGVTLKELLFQTTDDKWNPTIIKEAVHMIYKIVNLNSLSVYWNSDSTSYLALERAQILDAMLKNIAVPNQKTGYNYLVEPICSSSQLRLHTKPEHDKFSLSKILLNVIFEKLALVISKQQYQSILELIESLERMNLASQYRKYRPQVTAKKGNASLWWKFALTCVLENVVRRRRQMWSWQHIKEHRQRLKAYKAAYKAKLLGNKITAEIQKVLDDCEKTLSVFNITLVRQQAEMEAKKEGLKKSQEKSGGWFGGWFGGGEKKKAAPEEKDLSEEFQKIMTPEEKAKLYEAIGYQENTVDPSFPIEYEAHTMNFNLKTISLKLVDSDPKASEILNVDVQNIGVDLRQRPAANAISLKAQLKDMSVKGNADGKPCSIVSSQTQEGGQTLPLLDVSVATNPLDKECDTRIKLTALPLEIIYDAATINKTADFFKPPEAVYLKQLQAAAFAKFEEIREQTATGLQHIIEERKYTEIEVDVKPSYVILPEKGVYKSDSQFLLLSLGQLTVATEKQKLAAVQAPPAGTALDIQGMMEKAYDKFIIDLKNIQLLFVRPGENWKTARLQEDSLLHLLRPLSLHINLLKCMIADSNIPKMKVNGVLPKVNLEVSNLQLMDIMNLVLSIPFPKPEPPPPDQGLDFNEPEVDILVSKNPGTNRLVRKYADDVAGSGDQSQELAGASGSPAKKTASQEQMNITEMELKFEIQEISLGLAYQPRKEIKAVPIAKLVVSQLGTDVKIRTFDMVVNLYLGGIQLNHLKFKEVTSGRPLGVISTPVAADGSSPSLFSLEYIKAKKKKVPTATLR